MTGRRSFLKRVGVAGATTAVAVAGLPAPPASAPALEELPDGGDRIDLPWQASAVAHRDATPVARYQYRATSEGYEPTAPINVVFPLADAREGLAAVVAVFVDAGWTTGPEEYTRYAWDRETAGYVRQQASAAESYYGSHGRLHVRGWELEGVVSLQAHEDGSPRPRHTIASYERGRRAVESLFYDAGWTVSRAAIELGNAEPPDHDGAASVVAPGGDDPSERP